MLRAGGVGVGGRDRVLEAAEMRLDGAGEAAVLATSFFSEKRD